MAIVGSSILVMGCATPSGDAPADPAAGVVGSEAAAPVTPGQLSGTQARRPAGAVRPSAQAAAPVASSPVARVPEYREVTLPTGTALSLRLVSAVASDTSQVEDVVRATLGDGVTVDGATVLPVGTELAGTVTEVERSGRVKGRAHLAFRFGTIRHDGEQLPVHTEAIARTAEATKGEDAKKIGIGAGVGAALGAVIGGGDGAAKGAAIGAAAGTGAVVATRGEEVRLGAGDAVRTRLAAPLTVRVRVES
jgi:hypothetical protein